MPALGMAQDTGKLVAWLKAEGESVALGEAVMEIETDKATVEIEAPAAGILSAVTAQAGEDVPVGSVVAWILAPGEAAPQTAAPGMAVAQTVAGKDARAAAAPQGEPSTSGAVLATTTEVSPIARRMAVEHGLDLAQIKPDGGRIQKADVLAYLQKQAVPRRERLLPASPKARRLAGERGIELAALAGSGPQGAVLAADVEGYRLPAPPQPGSAVKAVTAPVAEELEALPVSTVWRVMAERISQAWTSVPHFYLAREANASRLGPWRELAQKNAAQKNAAQKNAAQKRAAQSGSEPKITITDLLVKLVAAALAQHLRLAARWENGQVLRGSGVHIGLAMAIEDGLTVPVIHDADKLRIADIAGRRLELVKRAQSSKLRPEDLAGGVFTISNLGMYGIDAFNAIINPPQAAILAVGRIADRVVALNGQPVVQPMVTLTLSCDHRVVDGARGAQFLQTLVELIEEPLGLVE